MVLPYCLIKKFKFIEKTEIKGDKDCTFSLKNINYSVILKTHEEQSGFPQFCGILVFSRFS